MSEEVFFRPEIFSSEERTLPAALYNLARLMVARSESGHVFVPVRSMQYLAVLDSEEFIFVDGAGNRTIAVSWCRFRPGARNALDEPVPYEAIYYSLDAIGLMRRLQAEFARALDSFSSRQAKSGGMAKVIPIKASA